jgi:hypothetical protein
MNRLLAATFNHNSDLWLLAEGADLLIHDTQYTMTNIERLFGTAASVIFKLAGLCDVKHFAPFQHDPTHTTIPDHV